MKERRTDRGRILKSSGLVLKYLDCGHVSLIPGEISHRHELNDIAFGESAPANRDMQIKICFLARLVMPGHGASDVVALFAILYLIGCCRCCFRCCRCSHLDDILTSSPSSSSMASKSASPMPTMMIETGSRAA